MNDLGKEHRYQNGGCDAIEYTNSIQCKNMLQKWKFKGIRALCREFDEAQDAAGVKMRMIGIWEAQETMERAVSERDDPSTFIA
jgi:hypothetical protein